MYNGLLAFLFSAGAVTLAEMGDKTQLLAMAFATKYKASKVMAGVFIATVLNHGLAVALGTYVARFDSLQVWIQSIAAISFIFFGLWTIKGDKLEGEENRKTNFGAVITVAVAFFIAEIADKTQLATIAIAAKFPESPLTVLMGTTTGMLIADAVGIIIGVVMCKKIPERTIKLVSAAAFIVFGFIATLQVLIQRLSLSNLNVIVITMILFLITVLAAYRLIKTQALEENKTVAEYCRLRNTQPE